MSNPYKKERTPFLIEFSKTSGESLVPVRNIAPPDSTEELEEMSSKAMDKAITIIHDTSQKLNSAMKSINDDGNNRGPNHIQVEFGIKYDTDYGVLLAKALNEASFNVKLIWNNLGT
jgi:hypothetical protein